MTAAVPIGALARRAGLGQLGAWASSSAPALTSAWREGGFAARSRAIILESIRGGVSDPTTVMARLTAVARRDPAWAAWLHEHSLDLAAEARDASQVASTGRLGSLLRGVDLFAGAGGLTLGSINAGCPVALSIERNADAVETARSHGHTAIVEDVGNAWLYDDVFWQVDVLMGGPPCQPFSEMGTGKGEYDPRDGFPLAIDAVDRLYPRRAVFENVRGFLSKRHTAYRQRVLTDMRKRFPWVGVWELNARDFGVPQDRRRVFVVGAERELLPPAPTHGPNAGQPYVTVREALPELGAEAIHVRSKTAKSRTVDDVSPTVATRGTLYTATRPGLIYGKDPHEGRRITPDEQAILQGFPSFYTFHGGVTSQYKQIGNAVPPPLGKAVIAAVTDGLVADRLRPAQVVERLKAANPSAQLYEPREVFDKALIGVTNTSPHSSELVAVYGQGRLVDAAVDDVMSEPDNDRDLEEVFMEASAYVDAINSPIPGHTPHHPYIMLEDEDDPVAWV